MIRIRMITSFVRALGSSLPSAGEKPYHPDAWTDHFLGLGLKLNLQGAGRQAWGAGCRNWARSRTVEGGSWGAWPISEVSQPSSTRVLVPFYPVLLVLSLCPSSDVVIVLDTP
ncbi:hypothetical protein HGRIS_014758 [Hohenbuehelia grisea]|uniref:Uncharacterized protein n=1 Tax=Hohenbuehelia grisea TaxID=104357 RepID=A0ABR3IQK2_9AGAR